jgi:hypothetical protein
MEKFMRLKSGVKRNYDRMSEDGNDCGSPDRENCARNVPTKKRKTTTAQNDSATKKSRQPSKKSTAQTGNANDSINIDDIDLHGIIREKRAQFAREKERIPELQKRIESLREQSSQLGGRHTIRRKKDIEVEIRDLEERIEKIEQGENAKRFEEKVQKYIDAEENVRLQLKENNQIESNAPASSKIKWGIMGFSDGNKNDDTRSGVRSAVKAIVKEYLAEFEGQPPPMQITQQDICDACGDPLYLSPNNSLLMCNRCKFGYPYMDTTTASMAYGDEIELSSFTYKKDHHFEDWLKKFQAKGSKRVEKSVIKRVMQWLYQKGFRSRDQIQREHVRTALRETKLGKYYDHVTQIYCRITGYSPPYMSPEREEICRMMFRAIQGPFVKWVAIVDPTRWNFLSYAYTLRKFCELHGWTEYFKHFNLLKGKQKLLKQDEIWKGICKDMDWEFIPSV